MNKSALPYAIALYLGTSVNSANAFDVPITNMQFGPTTYASGGTLLEVGGGTMNSIDDFSFHSWTATQQTLFMDNTDSWANNATKSSGALSAQGPYDYDAQIQAMTDNQIAVGLFFDWFTSSGIAVLEIFDCDALDKCNGNGSPMANGPFGEGNPDGTPTGNGSVATFNAGLTCEGIFQSTGKDTPLAIDIAVDILANDAASIAADPDGASNCSNPTLTGADIVNPPGLALMSVDATSASGGTVIINGTVVDFTPRGDYEGPDKFNYVVTDGSGQTTTITADIQIGGALQNNFTMMGASGSTFGGTNDVEFDWDGAYNSNVVDGSGILAAVDFDAHIAIGSPNPFLNFNWSAHHIRIFQGPGTFKFDVTCIVADYDTGIVDCNRPLADQGAKTRFMTMTLEAGEMGGHMLFDWGGVSTVTECGQANCNIDVVNRWKENAPWEGYGDASPKNDLWIGAAGVTPATDENSVTPANWELVSTDVKGYTDVSGVVHTEGNNINGAPMLDGAFVDNYANFNKTPDKAGEKQKDDDSEISDVDVDGFSFSLWTLVVALFSVFGLRRVSRSK